MSLRDKILTREAKVAVTGLGYVGLPLGVAKRLHPDQLVVLESTIYPGTTQDVLLPMFGHRGVRIGRNSYVAFSPRRIDLGNKEHAFKNAPRVVAGYHTRIHGDGEATL